MASKDSCVVRKSDSHGQMFIGSTQANLNQDLVLNWVGGSVQGKIKVLIEASRLVDGQR
jgi:hypothetical protein